MKYLHRCPAAAGQRTWMLLLAGALAAVVLVALLACEREPSYQGRSLRLWLQDYCLNYRRGVRDGEAIKAVRTIGTNGLPTLLRWFSCEPAPMVDQWAMGLRALPKIIRGQSTQILLDDEAEEHYRLARVGIMLLGTNAQALIPQLASFATNFLSETRPRSAGELEGGGGPDRRIAERAYDSGELLGVIGPAAVPALLGIVTNHPRGFFRSIAVTSLGDIGAKARPAIPTLLQCLQDPSPSVAEAATNALKRIAPEVLTNTTPR